MEGMEQLKQLAGEAAARGASDVHLTPGSPVMYRIDGEMVPVTETPVTPAETSGMLTPLLTEQIKAVLEEEGEVEFAYSFPELPHIRINIFRQSGALAAALHILASEIPEPERLGIPGAVVRLTGLKQGLVIAAGASGSGKTTTLAALINLISKNYIKNIITLESPVEYRYPHRKSMISQREIGSDARSYANALRASLHQDPDVILVGELSDAETVRAAVMAAETGHLVFAPLYADSAASALERMIEVFPEERQQQMRGRLANVIEGVVVQQLLPKSDARGRVAVYEVLLHNAEVSAAIREGRLYNIPALLKNGSKCGMQTMDDAIYDLYMRSSISSGTAVAFAQDRTEMQRKVKIF